MSTHTCIACRSTAVRAYPVSRKTDRIVGGCADCGTHFLLNPPAASEIEDNYDYDRELFEAWVAAKRQDDLHEAYDVTLDRLDELIASGGKALFDIGAGAGEFLETAQARGFEAHGNEFAPGAIEMTRDRIGVELHPGDLSSIEGSDLYDAVTMWCVLAHVSDPDALLADTLRVLKPGGVLFLQTPRWSAMDTAALGAARATGGRATRILDRRVSEFHMTLHSEAGLKRHAERMGFETIDITPKARYSLKTTAYLQSLGVPQRAGQSLAKVLDQAVERDLFFRNVLDLYARKPIHS